MLLLLPRGRCPRRSGAEQLTDPGQRPNLGLNSGATPLARRHSATPFFNSGATPFFHGTKTNSNGRVRGAQLSLPQGELRVTLTQ
jgi:hypothetical protein